jgi:hypothetical protein
MPSGLLFRRIVLTLLRPFCWLLLASQLPVCAQQVTLDWQPVQEYFSHAPPGEPPVFIAGTRRVNSFVEYTHLGTDFGFHGPAAYEIQWRTDEVRANLRQHPDAWAGMWHSLAGLARETNRTLNFTAPFPDWILPPHQPKISAIKVIARGSGQLKLEIQDANGQSLWTTQLAIRTPKLDVHLADLPSTALTQAKFLNWTAEPGSDLALDRLALGFQMPPSDPASYAFLTSYAKLSRCADRSHGLVRDRAHTESGAFDTIPTTGLFVLATAAAADPAVALVSPSYARALLHQVHQQVTQLKAPFGLLPHFAIHQGGHYQIHPGTEYSTIDTAIYFHCALLAAEMLGEQALQTELLKQIRRIDFQRLRLPDGSLSHGLQTDGQTVIPHGWRDWGGETAVVALLHRLADPASPPPSPAEHPGLPWQGTGFIPELQSLFYPDFDSPELDRIDNFDWGKARRAHLTEQQAYIRRYWRGTLAHDLGFYGLSAGENASGNAYYVSGTRLPRQDLIHPHYLLMSATLHSRPAELFKVIEDLRRVGLFPPYGLVENVTVTGSSYLAMNGSLNAGFEALSAYHLLCQQRSLPNAIYQASTRQPELRRAIQLYFPPPTTDSR